MKALTVKPKGNSLSEESEGEFATESALVKAEGPLDPYDTSYSVPHQQDQGKVVVFDLLTVTIDDIIAQCGYPESAKDSLTEIHRRIAAHLLAYYKGPIKNPIPLLEATAQAGVS